MKLDRPKHSDVLEYFYQANKACYLFGFQSYMNIAFMIATSSHDDIGVPIHLQVIMVCEAILSLFGAHFYSTFYFLFLHQDPDEPVDLVKMMQGVNYGILVLFRMLLYPISLISYSIFCFGSSYEDTKYNVPKYFFHYHLIVYIIKIFLGIFACPGAILFNVFREKRD